jgi:hypothetical protein
MAVRGVSVALVAGGAVLVFSGVENATLADTLRSLAKGRKPAAGPAEFTSISTGSGGGGGGTVTAPSGPGERAWITALMLSLGAPPTSANVNSVASWIAREGPFESHFNGSAPANNPMNTTQDEPGATVFNPQGVKNYPSSVVGIRATVTTLEHGYPQIVAALRSGRGLCGVAPDEFLKWSGKGYSSVC